MVYHIHSGLLDCHFLVATQHIKDEDKVLPTRAVKKKEYCHFLNLYPMCPVTALGEQGHCSPREVIFIARQFLGQPQVRGLLFSGAQSAPALDTGDVG